MNRDHTEVAIIGAGYAGIATAYFLARNRVTRSIRIIDPLPPMSYTSAQSGDNYRNWWPHPTMTALTNLSIDLLEQLARDSGNVFNMTRRGYLLVSRETDIADRLRELGTGYEDADLIRMHDSLSSGYRAPDTQAWESVPAGVDVLTDPGLIRREYPALSPDLKNVIHIRRAGDISGQQLGQYMLERVRAAGGQRMTATVEGIVAADGYYLTLSEHGETRELQADVVVNAAGPFLADIAAHLGVTLPVSNVFQQKIAFDDTNAAVPRQQPFTIDLDPVAFEWSGDEREFLLSDDSTAWLCDPVVGGVHCRPEGGDTGSWIKLGWAFNRETGPPLEDLAADPRRHPQFPEIVLRGAARMLPSFAGYLDDFPRRFSHYGGYYTMTDENWPLIGPMGPDGAFVVGALSGFGSMAAPAAGALCAAWIAGESLPDFASDLSPERLGNDALRGPLLEAAAKGLL